MTVADDRPMKYGEVPVNESLQTIEQALRSEVILLREVIRRYGRHEFTRPWMTHSPCDDAYERAMSEQQGDYVRVPGDERNRRSTTEGPMTVAGQQQLIANANCANCLADVHAFKSESGNTLLADVLPYAGPDGEGRCLVVVGSQIVSAIYNDVADRFTTFHCHAWHCPKGLKI